MNNRLFLVFSFIFLIGSAFAQLEVIDKVIANVGTEIVLLSDVEEQYALAAAQQGGLPEDARCTILDQLLAQKLLVNQAKLDSIPLLDAEVDIQLDARIDQILAYMGGDVKQFEEYYGQSIGEVKEAFREDLRNQILSEKMRSKIIEDISSTPSEVKDFFDRIPIDSLPYFNSEVEIGEIVYKPKVNEKQKQIAIEKLEKIRQRIIDGGEDFAELAKTYSDDFGSARIGGDLGWTKRGKFVPEFEAAAYKLDEDEISPIVESKFGFHLIQLLKRRGNSIKTRHILIKPEITDADMELAKAKLDSIRTLLVTSKINFSLAVKNFSDENVQSYNNDGRMVNPRTSNTFWEIADLDPDVYFTIDTMKVGTYSAPFSFTDASGESFFRIVNLQTRTAPHKASLETDYSKIQAATIQEKKSKFVNDWVADKVNSTYIRIDRAYDHCTILSKWRDQAIRP